MKPCPIAKRCGSCQYMHLPYPQHLEIKKKTCEDALKVSKVKHIKVVETEGMEVPFYYRNKVILAFNKQYEYGLYEENSHKIIPYQRCLLHEEETDTIIKKIQNLLKRYRVSIYDENRGRGLLRHIVLRRAIVTNQTMIVLVCNEPIFKGSKNFCQELVKQFPSIKTIILNINKRKTSIVLGQEEKVLYGPGYITDILCGLKFKISPASFYQINHEQCEKLYTKALSLLQLKGNETIIDAYCGIGTIGMLAAKDAKQVLGVELNKEAIKDAKNNAKRNEIRNINFICADASTFMKQLAQEKQKVDAVIMDPPRVGSTKIFMDAIKTLQPKQVVYISCNPLTQIRDLEYFKVIGYQTTVMYPVDMFPYTKHIESIVRLIRK